jgi:hypothetical protein
MNRLPVVLVLVLALLWQSLALARAGSSVNVLVDSEHAALHLQGTEHHHHDDGSYHASQGDEADQHLLGDPLGAGAALLPEPGVGLAGDPSPRPQPAPSVGRPTPVPDGLLRPPRHQP